MMHTTIVKAVNQLFRADRARAVDRFIDYVGESPAPIIADHDRVDQPPLRLAATAR